MASDTLSDKQKMALALSRKGLRDHQIASVMGLQCRESACRLRRRGLAVIKASPAVINGIITLDQVIDTLAAAVTKPTPSLALALGQLTPARSPA